MVRYCNSTKDIEHVLDRQNRGRLPGDVEIRLSCSTCHLTPAYSVPLVVIDHSIYCKPDALKVVRKWEPDMTEAKFDGRLAPCPYEGVFRLFRYQLPSRNGA